MNPIIYAAAYQQELKKRWMVYMLVRLKKELSRNFQETDCGYHPIARRPSQATVHGGRGFTLRGEQTYPALHMRYERCN